MPCIYLGINPIYISAVLFGMRLQTTTPIGVWDAILWDIVVTCSQGHFQEVDKESEAVLQP